MAVAAVGMELSRRAVRGVSESLGFHTRRIGICMLMCMVPNVERCRRHFVLAIHGSSRPGELDWQEETEEKQQPTRHSVRSYLLSLTTLY